MRRTPRLVALLALLVVTCGVAAAGVPRLVWGRGWAPLVQLAGAGDPDLAVERLGLGLDTLRCVLHDLRLDDGAARFVRQVRSSLGDLDLEGLHGMLPLREGEWRRVRLVGQREGAAYAVRLAPAAVTASTHTIDPGGPLGARTGDLLALVGTRQRGKNFVTQLEVGLGVGPVGWDQITEGLAEAARLLASGDPRAGALDPGARPATSTRLRVVETHPGLRPEDVEVVAVLWESFPHLAEVLLEVARFDDVLVLDFKGTGAYQQLRLSGRLRPDLMEARYPALSGFLAGMGPLLDARVRWVDAEGRQIARMSLDTGALALTLEGFVADGRLLPVGRDGQVVLDAPAAPEGAPVEVRGVADLRFNMNGILTDVRGLEVDGLYERRPDGADLTGRLTRVPQVVVSGNAFGFLPSWAIDIVLPSNLAELTTEFFTAICRGDGGRGATFGLRARQREADGPATLALSGQVEVLNSLLIRLGFRIANQKLLPGEKAREELWTLLARARDAFERDLGGFSRVMKK
ncbi:MAG: hypothetical protein M9894_23210 [Planctomycetes bacterium]|nr:hypothetical protein [Planctomycetota bacterium]